MSVAMNEQETVIRFGRDSEECEIYTSDTTVMTKLDKLASKNNDKAPLWKLKEEHDEIIFFDENAMVLNYIVEFQ